MERRVARYFRQAVIGVAVAGTAVQVGGCGPDGPTEVRIILGSALSDLCGDAVKAYNQSGPKRKDGGIYAVRCDAMDSGDIIREVVSLVTRAEKGEIKPDDPSFPLLIALEGDLYHSQLQHRLKQIFPSRSYVTAPTDIDSPLIASSPLVYMMRSELATEIRLRPDVFHPVRAAAAKDPHAVKPAPKGKTPPPPVYNGLAHANPAGSSAGLETLVAELASAAGREPAGLTVDDVARYEEQVRAIEARVVRYGRSTDALARDILRFGPPWASIAAVHESSVIQANRTRPADVPRYEAVYPATTFASEMRAITFNASWISPAEQKIAEDLTNFLRSVDVQKQVVALGLRPASVSVPLEDSFKPENGVDPNARYKAWAPPPAEVADALVKAWKERIRRPTQTVVAYATSGSMRGTRLESLSGALEQLILRAGPLSEMQLLQFSSKVGTLQPVDGADPKKTAQAVLPGLKAEGGARLYDATLAAHAWLVEHYRSDAINSAVVLTDGDDAISDVQFDALKEALRRNGVGSERPISFYFVGFGPDMQGSHDRLIEVADLSGGRFVPATPKDIADVTDQY